MVSEKKRTLIEICTGLIFIVFGFILDWWSKRLVWIQIYPQPLAKSIIEILPFLFWGVSALLITDGLRRIIFQWKEEKEHLNDQ